tara:strand:+ start:905 stop:1540 length:636 start_codon:yes stop_codon:yes gene_type:complete
MNSDDGLVDLVRGVFEDKPFLKQRLLRGNMTYAEAAEVISQNIKRDKSDILDVLRKMSDEIEEVLRREIFFDKDTGVVLTPNVMEVTLKVADKERAYEICSFVPEKEFLLLTYGHKEISFVTWSKYKSEIMEILGGVEIVDIKERLSSVSVKLTSGSTELLGIFYIASRALKWADIPIVEIYSTLTDMTFIVEEKYSIRTLEVLKGLVGAH